MIGIVRFNNPSKSQTPPLDTICHLGVNRGVQHLRMCFGTDCSKEHEIGQMNSISNKLILNYDWFFLGLQYLLRSFTSEDKCCNKEHIRIIRVWCLGQNNDFDIIFDFTALT